MPQIEPLGAGEPRQLGPFRVVGRIGEGGQGVVYLGTDAAGERVAIKLLHVKFSGDAIARSRFAREARAAQRVASFCTAAVVAVDLEGDTPYIASEYIEGRSLRQVVEADGPLSGAPLQRLAVGTATALTAIHHASIVHRDLKPDNVLMAADGPRVVDFGIARIIDSTGTITSRAVGTPAYMAPEQVSGDDVGPYTDVFAWGATIAYAATGEMTFGGGSIAVVLSRILTQEVDVGMMPEPLRSTVRAALAKDPAARPSADRVLLRLLGHPEAGDASPAVLTRGVQLASPAAPVPAGSGDEPGTGPDPETGTRPQAGPAGTGPGEGSAGTPDGHGDEDGEAGEATSVMRVPGSRPQPPAVPSTGFRDPRFASDPPVRDPRFAPDQPVPYGSDRPVPYVSDQTAPYRPPGPSGPGRFDRPPSSDAGPPGWEATRPVPLEEPGAAGASGRPRRARWIALVVAVLLIGGAATAYATGWRPSFLTGTASGPGPEKTGGQGGTKGDSLVDRVAVTKRLTVGMRDFLPGVALQSGGRWAGFEVDLATEIARELGVPAGGVTFRATRLQERPGLLASGEVDMVVATYPIDEDGDVTFAGPYYLAHVDVLVRDDSPIASLAGLENRRLCAPAGSSAVGVVRDAVPSLRPVPAGNYAQCMDKLLTGEVDAVPGDDLVLAGYADPAREATPKRVLGLKLTDERYAVALKKGDERACRAVRAVIAGLYREGRIKEMLDEHFPGVEFPTREDAQPAMADCG
ncbi:transporter substrate-binding domain-containing protein [Planomonospora sp. ID91781]|uniref:serine/threonine-protein kinase n=1 Tax=Planomonospora sp. ID91781 TaxID=2738135 RepID=UPI0018C3B5D7|nr:serine/threonine-protein kinase [Planomonospora sp. ID91781]MBG0820806.1 transporter substrate-binding domain-containing protein [Planomonospora sp. ID91781]